MLELTCTGKLNYQGNPGFYQYTIVLINSGNRPALNALIDLAIIKPSHLTLKNGLSFNEAVGKLEDFHQYDFLPKPEDYKPRHFKYRLNSGTFINTGDRNLSIASFAGRVSSESSPDELDHVILWTIYSEGIPPKSNKILIDGCELKDRVVSNIRTYFHQRAL